MILVFIVVYLLLVAIILELVNRLYYKKLVGVVALKKDNRTIVTTFSVVTIVRYLVKGNIKEFIRDCRKFFKLLDKDVEYYTNTHELILKRIKRECGETNVLATETKMKTMVFSKLFIGNTENLFETHQYYDVTFIIK